MLVETIEYGKKIHVKTIPESWAYAAELQPPTGLPDEPFILNCKAAINGDGAVGFGAANAARDDITHAVFLRGGEKQQSFDIVCSGRQNFGGFVVRTGEPATSCDVTLTILGIKPIRQENYTIFQYGKVGSQTVEAALLEVVPTYMVQRNHFMTTRSFADALSDSIRVLKSRVSEFYPTYFEQSGVLSQVRSARKARSSYLDYQSKGKAVLITGVRDPVETCIAAYFQQLEVYCEGLNFAENQTLRNVERALERFYEGARMAQEDLPARSQSDQLVKALFQSGIARWFATEFLEFTGVDILNAKFDSDAPFARFQENGHDILVFRTERLSEAVPLMMDSLGLAYRPVPTMNVGSLKPTGAIYRKFKERFVESATISQLLRTTDYCRRFYPDKRQNVLEGLPICAGF